MKALSIVTWIAALGVLLPGRMLAAGAAAGTVTDPRGDAVAKAIVEIPAEQAAVTTDEAGRFRFESLRPGRYKMQAREPGFVPVTAEIVVEDAVTAAVNLQFLQIAPQRESLVVSADTLEPAIDLRQEEVFDRTLFTRDDQIFYQLNAGINAGQHEGGGKSLEIRRFGFNMDHGGVNGGLKVLVDGVQQNQSTQGHGQGYLGALKSLSPELIEGVTVLNGPFSPQYGDFSGLGVVHIHQRESLGDLYTIRMQGGSFNTARGFIGFSPHVQKTDSYIAYEGAYTDGPFRNPGRYRRDNVNGNYSRRLSSKERLGVRFLFGRNGFYSSGQIPLDLVEQGALDRFGTLDPTTGGRTQMGTFSAYYSRDGNDGSNLKVDGFVSRSLFDLYSNFTSYWNDPVNGDGIQQHDSRLQEGINVQFTEPHGMHRLPATLSLGGNFHDNQINVGLYPQIGRVPYGVTQRANAHVTNGAGYAHETVSLFRGRVTVAGGLRYDWFRFGVRDRILPEYSGAPTAGRLQGKASIAWTPLRSLPFTLHANYGRGINSADARGIVQRPDRPRVATTDFYQAGTSYNLDRFGFSADAFWIDHSHEQVYIPDDGTIEFQGPSRAYGFEMKSSVQLTRHVSLNGGFTKIVNAFFRGSTEREYVTAAPHFVANAALTVASWRGWSGSLGFRAVNRYRLDSPGTAIASGLALFDLAIARRIRPGLELNLSLDNLTDRKYYETQNHFESRTSPTAEPVQRIHATPGYPLTAVIGLTLRFGQR